MGIPRRGRGTVDVDDEIGPEGGRDGGVGSVRVTGGGPRGRAVRRPSHLPSDTMVRSVVGPVVHLTLGPIRGPSLSGVAPPPSRQRRDVVPPQTRLHIVGRP